MEFMDYEDFTDYNYSNMDNITTAEGTVSQHKESCLKEGTCMLLTVINVVIFLLGFFGNMLVIWISGFKMRKTVNTTWYLSLAMSDFLFCAFLPFNIVSIAMKEWFFGSFMCKFTSAALFINMFSSIFLLIIISMDRCVSVMFPVWAQNHRSVQKASAVVVFAWLLAAGMSIPSLIYRQVHTNSDGSQSCYTNYDTTSTHMITVVTRFIVGFVVPFTIIIICYSIIIFKLQNNRMAKSSKPFKVMTALIVAFFVCWLPYHVFVLMELNHRQYDLNVLTTGIQMGVILASANSFLNPLLYVFMGNDFQKKLKSSLLSKMENAMADEGRTTSRYLSRSSSMDGRASTHI
ncbi:chemokine-like receptor 1 [Poecilia latipinna]|uniref:Chemerin chemokine-like receptor 1 n=1 Tax=Poecilia latipinna TaxID=48699 RepID=A0A3B3TK66_9TELE|nr:PREDICTED: chemokine-like receptor 1 [Poecilia latipinna]